MLQESCSKTQGLAEKYVAMSPANLDRLEPAPRREGSRASPKGWIARLEKVLDKLSRDVFGVLLGPRWLDP